MRNIDIITRTHPCPDSHLQIKKRHTIDGVEYIKVKVKSEDTINISASVPESQSCGQISEGQTSLEDKGVWKSGSNEPG